ncbi:lipoamide acyltransferase component of branched-chain alpha-keto acid dehydrogenase complex, mitochondrial isoform X1 [Selaginella moellendorffii]|uniref:lipoamide acyltransferase component of branched-chain alpha-keto acid dehydrogenase complex, mitochondrial isoform X1 n=1 Tax=Selaginella moellendorffii TaxID=88036 RepID=UPI000D1C85E1|nr:lipoamide acyltransferase component of branched-chain alpha-keto acid dehydrogenase complex, mitochondrial isoform X1 [Selaginella moellendorffii]|eukprot:XP_024527127.1 lipoamide acyltransferase component of branched-chain alpha-keto acid dehydrogenase complex, mitochondrial isoform X1 [Selaginella moellendorffii]
MRRLCVLGALRGRALLRSSAACQFRLDGVNQLPKIFVQQRAEKFFPPRQRNFLCTMSGEAANMVSEAGIVEVPLAQTGEGIVDCELVRWFVKEGECVEEFQPLCEVQSDKATIEITSRYKGKVSKVNFMPGAVVKVGETLLEIMISDGDGSFKLEEKENSQREREVLATPAVRSLARQLGIALKDVAGSGEAGRVLKDDVLKIASVKEAVESDITGISSTPAETGETVPADEITDFDKISADRVEQMQDDKVIPVRGFRRIMAKTMAAAASVPHFHYMEEINVDALVKLRAHLQLQTRSKLTFLPFLIKALSLTLVRYPILNSNINQDASEIRCKTWHNVGVAMATDSGLAVPNIKQVQKLSLEEIADEITRLSKLAAANKLTPDDVSNGTITVSNFGAIGGKFGSPVLNLPEAAILAVGRIQKLPRFNEEGRVYPASIMSVTLGADHRVIDGATIARFCNEWKDMVEHPEKFLLSLK